MIILGLALLLAVILLAAGGPLFIIGVGKNSNGTAFAGLATGFVGLLALPIGLAVWLIAGTPW